MKYYKYDYNRMMSNEIKSVIITPLDMIRERPKRMSVQQIDKIDSMLAHYLEQNGIHVFSDSSLVSAWENESKKMGGFFDQTTGELIGSKINTCLTKSITQVRQKIPVDGTVLAQFIVRSAQLAGDRVYWDGCSRKLFDPNKNFISEGSFSGKIDALSLQIKIFNRNNQLVFQNIGGIEFPYILSDPEDTKEFVWKDSLTLNQSDVYESICLAFHPFIKWVKYPKSPYFYEEQGRMSEPRAGYQTSPKTDWNTGGE
jgi:hypothetical protein